MIIPFQQELDYQMQKCKKRIYRGVFCCLLSDDASSIRVYTTNITTQTKSPKIDFLIESNDKAFVRKI